MAPVATATATPGAAFNGRPVDLGPKGEAAAAVAGRAPPPPGAKVPSLADILTSGQFDTDESVVVPYSELPQKIEGPTVWAREEYEQPENREKWVRTWTSEEIQQLGDAAKAWVESGRPHEEIERATIDLPVTLQATLLSLRHKILHGSGFYLLKGFPVKQWPIEVTAAAYLMVGAYLGNAVSQNGKGHLLGHVKDIEGANFTGDNIDKIRIYRTSARQHFHVDSSGGLIGLCCLHRSLEGGESDVVSSHHLWNYLQEHRPDVAETLTKTNWWFDRKGEVSEGQKPYMKRSIVSLVRGQPPQSLVTQIDPYYLWSTSRFVEAGEIPGLSDEQTEAMKVLEETAQKLALHMVLEEGDCQFVSDTHVLHARTAYRDHPPPHPRRHLLRLWLSTPASEGGWVTPYPDSDHPRRGGIQVGTQKGTCPLDAE
ncbi:unnamed protein product [Parajaminaea phylloscopi]